MRAVHVGARGQLVRDERLAAARRVIDVAIARGVEFVVLAGDTFEDNHVDRTLVQRVADVLGRARCPVYVLPGNHDPLCAGSVWHGAAWASHANVRVLRDDAPVAVDGGTLWPCPLTEKLGRGDPTQRLAASPRTADHGIRVAIAHGTVEGIDPDENYFPIPADAAERGAVDYLALGHWHSFFRVGPRTAYSGSHEPTKFGERDSGNAIVVEIDAPGAAPRLTSVRTGRLAWQRWDESCTDANALARLIERVERLADADATLLELTLTGVLGADDGPRLARLRELLAARTFHHRIDDRALRPSPDAAWIERLPAGAVRAAAERLREWSDPAIVDRPADDRPADASPGDAARALLELYALAEEG